MKKEKKSDPFDTLKALSKKARLLKGALEVLAWDQETYMPEGAIEPRADKIELLAGLVHEMKTGTAFKKALSACIDIKKGKTLLPKISKRSASCLEAWRRDFLLEKALPTSFVEEFSKACARAQDVWKQAKKEDTFTLFLPHLEKIVTLNRKKADLYGYKDHPYDALLNEYEPEMTVKIIAPLFERVKKGLLPLLENRIQKNKLPALSVDPSLQMEIAHELLEKLGYDFRHGRLDISAHPFSTAFHPKDSRITTRISKENPLSNILTVLHEAGHALYEMGLPEKDYGTPLAEAVSLGIHESQSRFWETRIGLSLPFWKGYLPLLQKKIPVLKKLKAEDVFSSINAITPSFIRTESDEVTYPFHVILRFELEKGLIEGSIKPKDIPELWRSKMKESLGIAPKTDREGSLQDVHWSMGAMGYFPTYLLGTLFASQFFEAFEKQEPEWEKKVAKLDFAFIKEWLRTEIHQYGREFSASELVKRVSKKPISEEPFLKYLHNKHRNTIHKK